MCECNAIFFYEKELSVINFISIVSGTLKYMFLLGFGLYILWVCQNSPFLAGVHLTANSVVRILFQVLALVVVGEIYVT